MNWIAFDSMLLNLDHTISIDRVGSKSLEIYIEGSPNLESKCVDFKTKEDCDKAFNTIKAFVTKERIEKRSPA